MYLKCDFLVSKFAFKWVASCRRYTPVDIYGFHVTAAHGALYHYYDACDTPANTDRDSAEWHVVGLCTS